eukprot:TRINITY_DN9334_c0_g2_i1.p1 TRINITY_DN9334_c0_g2~~TRINITY_DN9334_c0_g2_i1.p1  ORF type:complete len:165 (+),score=34.45 TRINITY_DN9334_c0_g2_i1:40-534(+)
MNGLIALIFLLADTECGPAQVLSSLELYVEQIVAGNCELDWTPLRVSSSFFRDNAKSMSMPLQASHEPIIRLMSARLRNEVARGSSRGMAVLCHDIGQFARHFANGRKYLERDAEWFGGVSTKEVILGLIEHGSNEVAVQALKAAQMIMCTNWELMDDQMAIQR